MNSRGLSLFNLKNLNSSIFNKNDLTPNLNNIVFEIKKNLTPDQVLKLNLNSIDDGANTCYFNPLLPILLFYFKNQDYSNTTGVEFKLNKKKVISSYKISAISFNEPDSIENACEHVLGQNTQFGSSIILKKEFFIENNFLSLACFASNYNPNFFQQSFLPIFTDGSTASRFKIYKEHNEFKSVTEDLIFYPWGFKYKNFSSWNHNLAALVKMFVGQSQGPSIKTLLSVFPKESIKEISFE